MGILALTTLTMAGRRMSKNEARSLESAVENSPEDNEARIKLIAYYFSKPALSRVPRGNACKHIFWFVLKDPGHSILGQPEARPHFDTEFDDLYQKGEKLWNEQLAINSNNVAVLCNAANYFYYTNWGKAILLLEAALKIEPTNEQIKDKLAFTCELGARRPKSEERLRRAMELREELAKVSGRSLRKLVKLAETAYLLNDFDKCRINAEKVLNDSTPYDDNSDQFHVANQLIGILQLRDGDRASASKSLLRSVQIKSSPVLGSFGPKLQLARELLALGERSIVSKYLRDCSVFWESGQARLAYWWLQIQLGVTSNLNNQGTMELFIPRSLNKPATKFMAFVRKHAND